MTKFTLLSMLLAGALLLAADAAPPAAAEFLFPEDNSAADALLLNRRRGDQAMTDGLYRNAAEYFQLCCEAAGTTEPDASIAHARLAKALLAAEKPQEALDGLEQWLAGSGANARPAEKDMLELFRCEALLQLGRNGDAMQTLPELANRPRESQARFPASRLLANEWLRHREWTKALELLEARTDDFPPGDARRTELLFTLARTQLAAEKFAAAEKTLALIDQDAGSTLAAPEALLWKLLSVQCRLAAGAPEAAWQIFAPIQNLCPAQADADWWTTTWPLAQACFSQGMDAPAKTLFQLAKATAASPESRVKAGIMLAECCVRLKQSAAAKAEFALLIEEFPAANEYSQIVMRLAELKHADGERRSAAELFMSIAQDDRQVRAMRFRAAMQAADCLSQEGALMESSSCYQLAATIAETPEKAATALLLAAETAANAAQDHPELYTSAVKLYLDVAEKYSADVALAAESRLEAGRLLTLSGDHAAALEQFQRFIQEQPKSERIWEARLAAGIARKTLAKDDSAALKLAEDALYELAKSCPIDNLSAQAYFEAAQSAIARQDQPRAITLLNEFLSRFPNHEQAQVAMHRALLLCVEMNRTDEALALGGEFLKRYPKLPESAEIALLLGDQQRLKGNFAEARNYYAMVRPPVFSGALVPLALFECADCAWRLNEFNAALEQLQPLTDSANPLKADKQLLAEAQMLYGDIKTSQSAPEAAINAYAAARNIAGDTIIGYAALARQAELLLAQGSATHETLKTAQNCLAAIARAKIALPQELKERAMFLQARCAEKQGDTESAINLYQRICLNQIADRNAKVPHPEKYYALAVWELTRLLELKGDPESLRLAAYAYEGLAATALPRADEAAARAAALRENHHLGQ